MYQYINYRKIFEAEETGTPVTQAGTPVAKQPKTLSINVSEEDITRLESAIAASTTFEIPVNGVSYTDGSTETSGTAYFMFVEPGGQLAGEALTRATDLQKTSQNYLFIVEKTENHKLSAVLGLAGSAAGEMATNSFTRYSTQDQVSITFTKADAAATPTEAAPADKAEEIASVLNTGEVGSNPQESANRSIMSFDSFVSESKKGEKWIADVIKEVEKGGLRKEMGKKKGEKISAKELAKSEAKLKKKDKDKKKPGLQLNAKDAKTHKRNVLAKNLMKASGAMNESRKEKIKDAKDQLIKLHEVIEKMIKQTSKKIK